MSQIALQTPIPAQGFEALVAVAIVFWLFVVLLSAHRFGKMWKYFGGIISFLVYVLGVLFLEILIL